ncbi:MAG: hypothetical protein ACI8TX_001850 [Hyphomicrobiaceae bacterium]|jgi:hypothetical protein
MRVNRFPFAEACILDSTVAGTVRVAIAIAPKAPWGLASYDSDRWEITVHDALTGDVMTKGISPEVPRATVEIDLLGDASVEQGDCPAFSPEEEPGSDREIVSSAICRPTGIKMRHRMEALVSAHTGDFTPTTFDWSADFPAGILGTGAQSEVEFCPCGERLVKVFVEEAAGIETIEFAVVMDAPELSLSVEQKHFDRFGQAIPNPGTATEPAATVEMSVTAWNNRFGAVPMCTWPELRWADASSTNGHLDETDVPAGPLQPIGDGCAATLTVWDPLIDGGLIPHAKRIRGVSVMNDGLQCGKTIFNIDTAPIAEIAPHDFEIRPLKPIDMKIGGKGVVEKRVRFSVANRLETDTEVEPLPGAVEVRNLDCPPEMVPAEVELDSSDVGPMIGPGESLEVDAENFPVFDGSNRRCSIGIAIEPEADLEPSNNAAATHVAIQGP